MTRKLRDHVADLDTCLARGETGDILNWLRYNIHEKGSMMEPGDLMKEVTGEKVSSEPLLDYLEAKYGEMFSLS